MRVVQRGPVLRVLPPRGTRAPVMNSAARPRGGDEAAPQKNGAGGGSRTLTGIAQRIFIPATAFAAALRRLWSGLSLHLSSRRRCCPSSLYTFPHPGAWL